MRWSNVMLLGLAAAVGAAPAAAGFRCDTALVGRGMTPLEVLERCGEPVYEVDWTDYREPGLFVRVHEWTYEQGDNRFRRQLTFENGRLTRIETRPKPGGPALDDDRPALGIVPGIRPRPLGRF